jgi:1-acyl-sn-glycerol-3-phosphate acyltransferase
MSLLRAIARLLRLLAHVLGGLWTIRTQFGGLSLEQSQCLVLAWSRRALAVMGVELVVQGEPPGRGPLLLVSNHISWLDILVLNAARPSRFVSKADVQGWPVLGRLVVAAGTLFIEREKRRDALRVVHHLAERLRARDVLTVFPEGTTGDGHGLLPFHANLLEAAIATDAPVLPVALGYADPASGQRSDAPAYTGDMTLLASLWRTLGQRRLRAVVTYGEAQQALGRDRRTWASALRQEISRMGDLPLTD